jgi:hypothetical protein
MKLKKNWFYKIFQIKQIIIKRTRIKFEGKTNWMTSLKNWSVRHIN